MRKELYICAPPKSRLKAKAPEIVPPFQVDPRINQGLEE